MDKKSLTERDTCTKFITPAIQQAGGGIHKQVLEEFGFTAGRMLQDVATGMTATGIKSSRLKEIPVPLPPSQNNTASSPKSTS